MSSAILYLAIIAIWAGVLIPRWLRRDTSQAKKSKLAREVPADAEAGEAGVQMADDAVRGERDDDLADAEHAGYEADGRGEARQTEARRRVLAARRRMLMILLTLAVLAAGTVAVGLAAWWVAVPPVLMLGGYLLLLREASRADADRAQALADAYREEQRRLRQADREAVARRAEQRTARIIDISERMRDEFYDQYADTERRAVGD